MWKPVSTFHVIWGSSGLQLNNFISSLCFGEVLEDCISTSHSSSNFVQWFCYFLANNLQLQCMYQALPPSFQPSIPLFFCIVACWGQGKVLVWKIDGYSIKPLSTNLIVSCNTISAWQVAESEGRDQKESQCCIACRSRKQYWCGAKHEFAMIAHTDDWKQWPK